MKDWAPEWTSRPDAIVPCEQRALDSNHDDREERSMTDEVTAMPDLDFSKPYCFVLDRTSPDDKRPDHFRACVVFEDEAGYHPTGNEGQRPWYWNEEQCAAQNARIGLSPSDVGRIISSSMRAQNAPKARRRAG